jgi:putative selenate reductase
MAELYPIALGPILHRALQELDSKDAIFALPRRKWWQGTPDLDLSVDFLGRPAANAVGPAAGPQSQLIQNIILSWLAGSRIFELKTVQILDQLDIPRPCIDARNVGYNVEWSQELTLEQSLEEYVGAWVAVHVLRELDPIGRKTITTEDPFVFDMSVGYDLAGIQSERVNRWIAGMRNARTAIDQARMQLDGRLRPYRDIPIPDQISDTITLSTFHGCPPHEIEQIGEHILKTLDMDLIVKLNPTLLGYERVVDLVRGDLGYDHVYPVADAFEEDLKWEDALPLLQRLNALATQQGRRFGIKLTNTLVVENRESFFQDDRMYLSGQPLHVLAMNLLWKLRQAKETVGDWLPISFSAGIDRKNFADAVALGLTPVTTCTDLLRPGGYGRLQSYLKNLESKMRAVGANDIESFVQKAYGHDEHTRAHAAWLNTKQYVDGLLVSKRYHAEKNLSTPRKIGSHLVLFDCINCDKCIPVCPNNANFSYEVPALLRDYQDVTIDTDGNIRLQAQPQRFEVKKEHQLACYADFCNECGNCDIFCPEDGGPYIEKPLLFGTPASFQRFTDHDGYLLETDEDGGSRFRGRMRGVETILTITSADSALFTDGVVEIPVSLPEIIPGEIRVLRKPEQEYTVEMERLFAICLIYQGIVTGDDFNWVTAVHPTN